MLYTEMTKKALKLSFEAHKDQLDKSGMPYVFHPFHLAEQMETEEETIVALLHDVVEDSDYSFEDIKGMGFSDDGVEASGLMTHNEAVPYMDYVAKIKSNPLAAAVKLKDLLHNSDLSRVETVDVKAIKRVQKYADAVRLLTDGKGSADNLRFTCSAGPNDCLSGEICDGCLKLESKANGEYGSEGRYTFSKEDTLKLFSLLTLDEFINLYNEKQIAGVEEFLTENGIAYSVCFV